MLIESAYTPSYVLGVTNVLTRRTYSRPQVVSIDKHVRKLRSQYVIVLKEFFSITDVLVGGLRSFIHNCFRWSFQMCFRLTPTKRCQLQSFQHTKNKSGICFFQESGKISQSTCCLSVSAWFFHLCRTMRIPQFVYLEGFRKNRCLSRIISNWRI